MGFDTETKAGLHSLSALYRLWATDFVVEAVRAIATDQARRPDRYAGLPVEDRAAISAFRHRLGVDPGWPDFAQRVSFYEDRLGSHFAAGARAIQSAAAAYVQHAGTARHLAHRAAMDTIVAFRSQLADEYDVADDAQAAAVDELVARAAAVLRGPQLAQLFGVGGTVPEAWPGDAPSDLHGARLVGAVALDLFPSSPARMSAHKFLTLQQMAVDGAMTITRVLATEVRDDVDQESLDAVDDVMSWAYAWHASARRLLPMSVVVHAWRSEEYRRALSHFERRHVLEHPSGEPDLTGTELDVALGEWRAAARVGGAAGGIVGGGAVIGGGWGVMTHTVGSEICCSTGDLSCHTDASCKSVYEHCDSEGLPCPSQAGQLSCDFPCGTERPHHCFL